MLSYMDAASTLVSGSQGASPTATHGVVDTSIALVRPTHTVSSLTSLSAASRLLRPNFCWRQKYVEPMWADSGLLWSQQVIEFKLHDVLATESFHNNTILGRELLCNTNRKRSVLSSAFVPCSDRNGAMSKQWNLSEMCQRLLLNLQPALRALPEYQVPR